MTRLAEQRQCQGKERKRRRQGESKSQRSSRPRRKLMAKCANERAPTRGGLSTGTLNGLHIYVSTRAEATPSNPRGIPKAPFVDNVEDYVSSRADVEATLQRFQEMIS